MFKKWGVNEDNAKDILQSAYKNFLTKIRGENTEIQNIKNYIIGICRHKAIDELRSKKIDISVDDNDETKNKQTDRLLSKLAIDKHTVEEDRAWVHEMISKLKDPCRTLINTFYFELDNETNKLKKILEKFPKNYTSTASVKSSKNNCITKLQTMFNIKPKKRKKNEPKK